MAKGDGIEGWFRRDDPPSPASGHAVERGLVEQDFGALQGAERHALARRLARSAYPFWTLSDAEVPKGGESVEHLLARVGGALPILHLSVQSLSLTRIDHLPEGRRVGW